MGLDVDCRVVKVIEEAHDHFVTSVAVHPKQPVRVLLMSEAFHSASMQA
jgi:hypothetical protein